MIFVSREQSCPKRGGPLVSRLSVCDWLVRTTLAHGRRQHGPTRRAASRLGQSLRTFRPVSLLLLFEGCKPGMLPQQRPTRSGIAASRRASRVPDSLELSGGADSDAWSPVSGPAGSACPGLAVAVSGQSALVVQASLACPVDGIRRDEPRRKAEGRCSPAAEAGLELTLCPQPSPCTQKTN